MPHRAACRILVPQPGIESMSSAVEAQSPNHWTRTSLIWQILIYYNCYVENRIGSRVRERGWIVELGIPSIGVCYLFFFFKYCQGHIKLTIFFYILPFSSVQLLSCVRLFVTPWSAAHQASLSITDSRSLLKLMSIESVMPSSHLILCHPLLLLPPIPPSIRVFSSESTLHMRWPKYWSFSFSISPSNQHPGLISFRMDWLDLLAVQGILQESSPTPQFKSINFSVLSFLHSPTLTSTHDHWKNHSLD